MDEKTGETEQPQRGYQSSDVSLGRLFAFAAGVAGLVIFGVVISAVVFHYFVSRQPLGPPASPFENVRQLPPEPRLQTEAPQDLHHYLANQNRVLESYGWVDQKANIARIPVERAMEILLQKGFLVRGRTAPASSSAKPARRGSGAGS